MSDGFGSEGEPRLSTPHVIDPKVLAPMLGPQFPQPSVGSTEYLELPGMGNPNDPTFRRSWGERLTYNTGRAYLVGLVAGGSFGLYEGMQQSAGQIRRLRINAVLNATSRHGPMLGNKLGVIAMMYSMLEASACAFRDEDDVFNAVGAATATGVLYMSGSGPRAATIAGVAGGGLAAAVTLGAKQLGEHAGFLKNLI